jgi:hypothetical protein
VEATDREDLDMLASFVSICIAWQLTVTPRGRHPSTSRLGAHERQLHPVAGEPTQTQETLDASDPATADHDRET